MFFVFDEDSDHPFTTSGNSRGAMLLPLPNQFRNRLAIVCDKNFFAVRELSN